MRTSCHMLRLLAAVVLGAALSGVAPAALAAEQFPEHIDLPDNWQPEGIASGRARSCTRAPG